MTSVFLALIHFSVLSARKKMFPNDQVLVAIIVLCFTVLGFTLMVGDSLCELSIRERGMEFKAVLAYESKK